MASYLKTKKRLEKEIAEFWFSHRWGAKKTSPEARMIHAIYPQYPGYQAGSLIMT